MEIFCIKSRDEAVQLGMKLQRKHFIEHSSKGDHSFGDNRHYFRLHAFHTPSVLNSLRVWTQQSNDVSTAYCCLLCSWIVPMFAIPHLTLQTSSQEPINVIFLLSRLWGKLESLHITADGLVDHRTLRHDDFFWKFEDDVCELQKVSMKDMDANTKTAFVINLYNLMIKYAFVKLGIPETDINRLSFYDGVCVNVGGSIFSLNDLEHGILRANKRAPYRVMKQLSLVDSSKKKFSLDKVDPRIHFALNCGAKGCPAVKRYTAEALDEELRLAAMAFCEQDTSVSIDEENNTLGLSKIFHWYMGDFAASKEELPSKVAQYLRGEKKELLDKMIAKGKVAIKFLDYDWGTNDCNYVQFSKASLKSFPSNMYREEE